MTERLKVILFTIVFFPAIVIYGVRYVIKEIASVWWYEFKQSFRGVKK